MSEWYEIKDPDNVELSDDGKFVYVLFETDQNGNRYVEIPVEMLRKHLVTEIYEPADHGCTEEYHKRIRNKGVTRCGSCFKSLHYLDKKGNS